MPRGVSLACRTRIQQLLGVPVLHWLCYDLPMIYQRFSIGIIPMSGWMKKWHLALANAISTTQSSYSLFLTANLVFLQPICCRTIRYCFDHPLLQSKHFVLIFLSRLPSGASTELFLESFRIPSVIPYACQSSKE